MNAATSTMEDTASSVVRSPTSAGRVIMWTIPRSMSSAMALSMGQIAGLQVWYQPFGYARYAIINMKCQDGIDLPADYQGNEKLYERASELVDRLLAKSFQPSKLSFANIKKLLEEESAENVFVKDMAPAVVRSDRLKFIPRGYRHSFLIRHPVLMYTSMHKAYYKQFLDANMLDPSETDEKSFDLRRHAELGFPANFYKDIISLWKYVKEELDPDTVIIDYSNVLTNPSEVLSKYCKAVGLPYSEALLTWKAPAETMRAWKGVPEFGQNLHFQNTMVNSTGFSAPRDMPPRDQLTDDVIALSDAAMPYYEEMLRNSIVPLVAC